MAFAATVIRGILKARGPFGSPFFAKALCGEAEVSYCMSMIVDERIEAYLGSLTGQVDPVLAAMEALAERRHFPIVGRQAGLLLGILTHACGAKRVLELGSGYGYSALWFARALPEVGRVICTDLSADNRDLAMGYFRTAGLAAKIDFQVGDALAIARSLTGPFDIVFNDIDKESYPATIPLAVSLLKPGGLFISDNVLWSGKVADAGNSDLPTKSIRSFNQLVFSREDLECVILPVRDGLAVCRKK
jgi:caffeoyl-CoA O-methyltransferase